MPFVKPPWTGVDQGKTECRKKYNSSRGLTGQVQKEIKTVTCFAKIRFKVETTVSSCKHLPRYRGLFFDIR
jgi:hypothetical protein